ncbi:MAG: branched-chain amino acid ABC transporter permease [Candidatus Bathyarchaeia archaeon]
MLGSAELFTLNLLATFAPYIIVTISLNLEYGYCGVPNFGKTLAVAGGAFMAGVVPGRLLAGVLGVGQGLDYIDSNSMIVGQINTSLINNVPLSIEAFIITLAAAAAFGALLGFLIAYPVARLRADYLGMTFLAAGQVILVIGNNYPPLVGGTLGVSVPDPFAFVTRFSAFGLLPGEMRMVTVIGVMSLVAFLIFLYARKLTNSPLGRMLRAVRDDEDSALALGKDVQRTRITVIIFASAIAAIAGALYAFYTANVFATTYSRSSWTFWPWVMVILGGAANNLGVVAGTFIFVAVRQTITFYKEAFAPFLPFDVVWVDTLLLGLALLIILVYRPEGLIREKPIRTIKTGAPPARVTFVEPGKTEPRGFMQRLKKAFQGLLNSLKRVLSKLKPRDSNKQT